MLKDLITLLRPKQYYKNFLIFAGIIFSGNLLNTALLITSILGFIAFCLASSGQYIFNDIMDREKDRKHPKKRNRPIAAGRVKIPVAAILSALLLVSSILLSSHLKFEFMVAVVAYLVMNFLYSSALKQIVLLDVFVISGGFVLRAIAGCLLLSVTISPWLVVCTLLLALFLALGKRRNELLILGSDAKSHRNTLGEYTINAIDQMLSMTASATIVAYSLYTFFSHSNLMLTIPIVIYALYRYILLINKGNSDANELIFKDRGIVASVLVWILVVLVMLYVRYPS
jgi:4-hydroxybenzoate polyprenyltransferase